MSFCIGLGGLSARSMGAVVDGSPDQIGIRS